MDSPPWTADYAFELIIEPISPRRNERHLHKIACVPCYRDTMIMSFRDRGTQDVFNGKRTRAARRVCPQSVWRVAARKLDQLDSATELRDLRAPPGNRLEALSGDRAGQHSIRINDRYRVCFLWTDAGAEQVEIVDYHWRESRMVRIPTDRAPTHPGEMLAEEFLGPLELTQRDLANAIRVPYQRVNEIVRGRRGVTPGTALRLARFFDTSPGFWMNLQLRWDLFHARSSEAQHLDKIEPYPTLTETSAREL